MDINITNGSQVHDTMTIASSAARGPRATTARYVTIASIVAPGFPCGGGHLRHRRRVVRGIV